MFGKPLIGLNWACTPDRHGISDRADPLLPRWLECIRRADGIPLPVPTWLDEDDQDRVLELLQGFVFASAEDLSPQTTPEDEAADPRIGLVRAIAAHHIPYLGIGAGMQLLNVAGGGSLRRLDDDGDGRPRHVSPHHPRHRLITRSGSFIAGVFSASPTVTSSHAMAVKDVAVGMSVTGVGPDGVIEVLESETADWLAVGVQFLPEVDFDAADLKLFQRFADELLHAAAGNPALRTLD